MSKVTLESKDFEAMTKRIRELGDENKKLKEANKFLNDQIKEYNEKFVDRGEKSR